MTRALDLLRRIRRGQPDRVVAIVGRSGAGKSSFLNAGLVARLRNDPTGFAVLPIVRPDRAGRPIDGLWSALGLAGDPDSDDALRASLLSTIESHRGSEARSGTAPVPILAVDDAQELLVEHDGVGPLRRCLDAVPELRVVLTLRDDEVGLLDGFDREPTVPVATFRLRAIPFAGVTALIENPGARLDPPLGVICDLNEPLTRELAQPDALPLLAFTLERGTRKPPRNRQIDLGEYQRGLGGTSASINAAVTAAYEAALRDPACPTNRTALDALARSTLIPYLIHVDGGASPRLRAAAIDSLPRPAQSMLRHLMDQSLVRAWTRDGQRMVELAHGAVLRNWWGLAEWIRQERATLEHLDRIKQAAEEWDIDERTRDMLVHRGDDLTAAELMLNRPDFGRALEGTPLEYLQACRASETQRHQRALRRQRRGRIFRRAAGVAIVLLAVFAGLGLKVVYDGRRGVQQTLSQLLIRDSQAALDAGQVERAMRFAVLAASDTPLSPSVDGARFQLAKAALMSKSPVVLGPHGGAVHAAAYAPGRSSEASEVVTASADGTVRIWKRNAARRWSVERLTGHQGAVLSAAFAADGRGFVTGSADRTARVWMRQGREWTSTALSGHEAPVHFVAFAPSGTQVLTASRRGPTAWLWSRDAGGRWSSERLVGPAGAVERVAFRPDGQGVVVATSGGQVFVWRRDAGRWARDDLEGHRDRVRGLATVGEQIVTGADDRTVRVWRNANGRWIADVLEGHADPVTTVGISADGRRLVSGDAGGDVRLWQRGSTGLWGSTRLRGHTEAIESATFSASGQRILTAAKDGRARLWTAPPPGALDWSALVLSGHEGPVVLAVFRGDERAILTASDDGTARVWSTETMEPPLLGERVGPVAAAAYLNERTAITAADDGSLRVWGTSGAPATLTGHGSRVVAIAVAPDGARFATASRDATARVWRRGPSGWMSDALPGHQGPVVAVDFASDGSAVLTGSTDGSARVWRQDSTGAWSSATLSGHGDALTGVRFAPSGAQVVTVARDGTARLWRRASSDWRATVLEGAPVGAAAFGAEGQVLLTGGADGTARLWRGLASASPSFESLSGHDFPIRTVAIAPDGTRLLTAASDGSVRVWRPTESGEWRAERLEGHRGAVDHARFLPDSRTVLSASAEDGSVRIWRRDRGGVWLAYRVSRESEHVRAAALAADGGEVLTGGPFGARRHDVRWLTTAPSPAEDGAPTTGPSLLDTVCETRLGFEVVAVGPTEGGSARRPAAALSADDLRFSSVVRPAGGRVGYDVCAPTLDPVDAALSMILPRDWWTGRSE